MNKYILGLIELIKILNGGEISDLLKEELEQIADNFIEDGDVTLSTLIEAIENSMSYWEE